MIAGTYGLSGVMLIGVAVLFGMDVLTAWTQTFCWMAIFFVASAAASSAYLTASEIFPLETRAMAIALFYALGTLIGGVSAPFLFGYLIGSGSEWAVAGGYVGAAALMIARRRVRGDPGRGSRRQIAGGRGPAAVRLRLTLPAFR